MLADAQELVSTKCTHQTPGVMPSLPRAARLCPLAGHHPPAWGMYSPLCAWCSMGGGMYIMPMPGGLPAMPGVGGGMAASQNG